MVQKFVVVILKDYRHDPIFGLSSNQSGYESCFLLLLLINYMHLYQKILKYYWWIIFKIPNKDLNFILVASQKVKKKKKKTHKIPMLHMIDYASTEKDKNVW